MTMRWRCGNASSRSNIHMRHAEQIPQRKINIYRNKLPMLQLIIIRTQTMFKELLIACNIIIIIKHIYKQLLMKKTKNCTKKKGIFNGLICHLNIYNNREQFILDDAPDIHDFVLGILRFRSVQKVNTFFNIFIFGVLITYLCILDSVWSIYISLRILWYSSPAPLQIFIYFSWFRRYL